MTLRKKVTGGFLIVLLLVVCVGYVGIHSTDVMENQASLSSTISGSVVSLLDAQGAQLRYAMYGSDEYIQLFTEHLNAAFAASEKAQTLALRPQTLQELDIYRKSLEEYRNNFKRLTEIADETARSKEILRDMLNMEDASLRSLLEFNSSQLARNASAGVIAVNTGIHALISEFINTRLVLARFEINSVQETADELRAALAGCSRDLESLRTKLGTPEARQLGEEAAAKLASAQQGLDDFIRSRLERSAVLTATRDSVQKTTAQITALSGKTDASVVEASARTTVQSLTVIGAALLIGLLLAWFISRNVHLQLGKDPAILQSLTARVIKGDYAIADGSPQIGVYGHLVDMVGALESHINNAQTESQKAHQASEDARQAMKKAEAAGAEAQAKTQAMLLAADKLEEVAHIVSSASTELSAQIEQSERGAAEQAARVTETATAMEEMNSTVMEVAKNAGEASEVSAQTRARADGGAAVVEKAVASIRQVQRESLALKEDMATLARHAQSITQIMNVISDIADQTNLLALNAAIEAARAGDAGRGFAVVADEVRNLAEKTMASTTDVGNAIQAIQASAAKSVEQVDKAVQSIEEATDFANRSGEALQEIVAMADATADQVRGIAAASEQQSASAEEISTSITQVNTIAGETARAMEEAARAVSELANQAQVLTGLIENMKRV